MKKVLLLASITLGLASVAHAIPADTGTVTISGNVTAASCTASNATVTLPSVSVYNFTGTVGSTPTSGSPASLSITVACPATGTTATVAFDTSSGVDNANNLVSNTAAGGVTGVEVEILNSPAATNALSNSQSQTLSSGAATFNYTAQYVETSASVTPGTFSGSVGFNVTYN